MKLIKKIFEKYILLNYVINAFMKALLISVMFCATLFVVLKISGKYAIIANMLDLKYYSPWIIGPLLIATSLAVLSFIVGIILYLYKYKRSSSKSEFYKALSDVLNEKERRN